MEVVINGNNNAIYRVYKYSIASMHHRINVNIFKLIEIFKYFKATGKRHSITKSRNSMPIDWISIDLT